MKEKEERRHRGEFRQNLAATVSALLVTAVLLAAFSLFRARDLRGKLLCETEGIGGIQSFVYDFSSKQKTQLLVDGYTDVRRVTGYHGDTFYCCARQGAQLFVVKAENGAAARAFPIQSLPHAMIAQGETLYLLMGGEKNGAIVRVDGETGAQAALDLNVYTPGGFCVENDRFLFGRSDGEDVQWYVSDADGSRMLFSSTADVYALALYGGYAYFCDPSAGRLFRVKAETGERTELVKIPRLAQAGDAGARPVFAFSNSRERTLLLLTNGSTPLGFRVFLGKNRILYPVLPFGFEEKGVRFLAAQWI